MTLKLTLAELASNPKEIFTFLAKIGQGSYGSVHRARHISGTLVAIKTITICQDDLAGSFREIKNMTDSKHPHLVQFYGSYTVGDELWIVMEYCSGGAVIDLMRLCCTVLNEAQISVICNDVLKGLAYMHSKLKIHRDIKAGNILLTQDGHAVLADFGVVGQLSEQVSKRMSVIGTPLWMAPEVIQESGYDTNADIWSLGITCIEMAQGRPPHHDIHPMKAIFLIPSKPPPTFDEPEKYSKEFVDFVARCLVKDPAQRSTAVELLQDPFILNGQGVHVLTDLVNEMQVHLENGKTLYPRDSFIEPLQVEEEDDCAIDSVSVDDRINIDDSTMKSVPFFNDETVKPIKSLKSRVFQEIPDDRFDNLSQDQYAQLLQLVQASFVHETRQLEKLHQAKMAPLLAALSKHQHH